MTEHKGRSFAIVEKCFCRIVCALIVFGFTNINLISSPKLLLYFSNKTVFKLFRNAKKKLKKKKNYKEIVQNILWQMKRKETTTEEWHTNVTLGQHKIRRIIFLLHNYGMEHVWILFFFFSFPSQVKEYTNKERKNTLK